jgi:hypothetical protein
MYISIYYLRTYIIIRLLDVDTHPSAEGGAGGSGERGSVPAFTLHQCLDEYTKEEILEEENAWYCSACKVC